MPAEERSGNLLELLGEPTFAALATDTLHDYIDWDQLVTCPLPPGLSLSETWEALGLIRMYSGTMFPIPTAAGVPFWYSLDREAARCLKYIRRHCRADSPLHTLLQEREGHRFLVSSRTQEAVATCQLDGVVADGIRMDRMLRESRAPQTAADRLILNSYEMLRELDGLANEPITPELVHSMYERITHGVDLSMVERGPRRTNLAGTRNQTEMREEAIERDILQQICDFANGVTGDPTEPSVIKAYMIMSAMAYWSPLPDLNDTVGRHMFRLFAVKRNYPVLSYLPTSRMMLSWFNGELAPGVVRFTDVTRRTVVPGTNDGTRDILTHLQLTTAALGALLDHIEATRRADASLQESLESTADLNYRQRGVLARALGRPDTEFRIREHGSTYRVVYQTARTDLLDLETRGYLRRATRGKAFVFVAVDDLRARLERASTQA